MDLDQQLQLLQDEAPQHGVPVSVMKKAVLPVLKLLASQLRHFNYYIVQTPSGNWFSVTLTHREKPQPAKKVIYAFSTREDAARARENSPDPREIVSIPVTHLLFELLALQQVDSIIFLETPGNLEIGKEVRRSLLENALQERLKNLTPPGEHKKGKIPPNLA